MAEWQIIESDNFPERPPEEEPKSSWRGRGWGLLAGGLLLFLALAGFFSLRGWRAEQRVVLQEDLSAVIFEEEARRALGQPDDRLLDPEAPLPWQQAYRRTFEQAAASEVQTGSLARVDYFDGRCAVVSLSDSTSDPVRAYCLREVGWQRSPIPLPAWGEERAALELGTGIWLRFRTRDQEFAEKLAPELAAFIDRLVRLPVWSELSTRVGQGGLEIIIEPRDLDDALVRDETNRIIVNSPQLVMSQGVGGSRTSAFFASLEGEAAVRLALAEALLRRADLRGPASTMPGANRFVTAAQSILAMRMLPPETQAHLLSTWRAQLDGQWISPFFGDLLPASEKGSTGQAEAAARLLVDYIYQHHGPEALSYLLSRLPRVNSWNRLFGDLPMHSTFSTVAGRAFSPSTTFRGASEQIYSTMLLEIEAAYYAQAGQSAIARLRQAYSQPLPNFPLPVFLRQIDMNPPGEQPGRQFPHLFFHLPVLLFRWPYEDDRLGGRRLHVVPAGQSEVMLAEPAPGLTIQTPDGLPLSPGCLGPGAGLILEGEWLEAPRRLLASRMTLETMSLLAVPPSPPADTVAYLLIQNEQSAPFTAQEVSPTGEPRLRIDRIRPAQFLAALQSNGEWTTLIDLTPGLELFPLPMAAGEPVQFLIQFDLPNCERNWFAHYIPGQGFKGQWFSPPKPFQWVWRAERAEPIFAKHIPDERGYWLYEANQIQTFERPGFSNASLWFIGWQAATDRLVTASSRFDGSYSLGLLAPQANEYAWMANPPPQALQVQGLSPDGRWLAYPAGSSALLGPSNRVYLLDMSQPPLIHTLPLGSGAGLASLTWSPYLARPSLALLVGPIRSNYSVSPRRLLLLTPTQPEGYTEVTQVGQGQQLAPPVFCENGDLLYRIEQAGRYTLMRQRPDRPAQALLTTDRPFEPLACNN